MYFMPGALGLISAPMGPRMAGSIFTSSSTSRSISMVMAPGRSTVGIRQDTSTMVDSTPMPTGPPSIIISMRPFMSCQTWSAVVGLGRPEVLALGAATGTPARAIRRLATGSLGIRMATVSRPPVVP